MANFSSLKAKIKTILDANTKINQSYDYDAPKLQSFPCAVLVPSGNASDYDTTTENMRTYAFQVRLYIPMDSRGVEQAESTLTELIDELIDDFDQNVTLDGECLMMTAAPSEWGYEERDKWFRMATINLSCKVHFDTTI
jgi:hypothetical protein